MIADKLELLYFIIPCIAVIFTCCHWNKYNWTAKVCICIIFSLSVVSTFFPSISESIHHGVVVISMISLLKNNHSTVDFS